MDEKRNKYFVSRKQVEQSVFMIALSSPTIASSGGQPLDNGELGLVLPVTQQCYLQTTGPRIWQVCEVSAVCGWHNLPRVRCDAYFILSLNMAIR